MGRNEVPRRPFSPSDAMHRQIPNEELSWPVGCMDVLLSCRVGDVVGFARF